MAQQYYQTLICRNRKESLAGADRDRLLARHRIISHRGGLQDDPDVSQVNYMSAISEGESSGQDKKFSFSKSP